MLGAFESECGMCIVAEVNVSVPALRDLADRLMQRLSNGVVLLVSTMNGKSLALCKVSDPVSKTWPATDILNVLTSKTGGGGGGKPTMAQAGGLASDRISDGIDVVIKKMKKNANVGH